MLSSVVLLALLLALSHSGSCFPKIPYACSSEGRPWCDTHRPLDERINLLIDALPKPSPVTGVPSVLRFMLTARGAVGGGEDDKIGLPRYDWGANCVHGVQSRCTSDGYCPTSFPNPIGLGASFDEPSWRKMGNIIGRELRALYMAGVGENNPQSIPKIGLDCWSPVINIGRDPRWGRNSEVPGEDPYLTSRFGVAYTQGMQNDPADPSRLLAITTLKHFAAYSLEGNHAFLGPVNRHNYDANVTKYDLLADYFPAFEASVREGGAKGIMCSYNEVNGVPACGSSYLLTEVLRDQWGFDGYVTSDSGAVRDIFTPHNYTKSDAESVQLALRAGCDVNSGNIYFVHMSEALKARLINTDDIYRALHRTLKLRFQLGLFDPIEDQPFWQIPLSDVGSNATQQFNLQLTERTFVLLQNPNTILPLGPPAGKDRKIAVLGPFVARKQDIIGSYLGQICPGRYGAFSCMLSVAEGIEQRANSLGWSVESMEGTGVQHGDPAEMQKAADMAASDDVDIVIVTLGITKQIESESRDRKDVLLPQTQLTFVHTVLEAVQQANKSKRVVVVLFGGGSIDVGFLTDQNVAVVMAWYPSFLGPQALARVVFGDTSPSGKLPVTFYRAADVDKMDFLSMHLHEGSGRTHRYYKGDPLWPFGHGLTYTHFTIVLSGHTEKSGNTLVIRGDEKTAQLAADVTNDGERDGEEVIMVFFRRTDRPTRVFRQLMSFRRVAIKKGGRERVTFSLTKEAFRLYSHVDGAALPLAGQYEVEVTNGVDQRAVCSVTIEHSQVTDDVIVAK